MAKVKIWTRDWWLRTRQTLRRLGSELARTLERTGQSGGFMTP